MTLTPHFTFEEMTASEVAARQGLDNTPNAEQRANLLRLCSTILEPVRHLIGDRSIHVNSGFRSLAVNREVGGALTSAHLDGRAADIIVPALPLPQLFEAIARADLEIDQLIAEYGRWVHVGIARAGEQPRRQLLMKLTGRGYETYDPAKAWP